MKTFQHKVKEVVAQIPKGSVTTYKEVARRAGNERASRAVGTIMRLNFDKKVPCHRVVRSDGVIGEYNRGGQKAKEALLKKEGVTIKNGRVVKM